MRKVCFHPLLLTIVGILFSAACAAQDRHPDSKDHFPYAFENFVWWSDADLRDELKKHLPALGGEIERGSPVESRVRSTLIQLLREKGVQAEVQVLEPSMDISSSKRAPEAPPPSIVYSILSPPAILVDKVTFENAPPDGSGSLNRATTGMEGRPYRETAYWIDRQKIREELQLLGYLSSTVTLDHGTPRKDGDRYVVPVTASITAGPKFHVGSIKADGGPLVQGRDLSPFFAAKSGDVAIPNPFGRLVGTLRSVYWHAGYADVDFAGAPILDTDHALASYQLRVTPGPLYHLRNINIENLASDQVTKAHEMLGLKSGDVYDLMAVSGLNRKLSDQSSPLRAYDFSYKAKEDKQDQLVDLVLSFYKR